jgi:hypothetical protein
MGFLDNDDHLVHYSIHRHQTLEGDTYRGRELQPVNHFHGVGEVLYDLARDLVWVLHADALYDFLGLSHAQCLELLHSSHTRCLVSQADFKAGQGLKDHLRVTIYLPLVLDNNYHG